MKNIYEALDKLSDEDLNAIDTGPSHPHYYRAVRKAERLGGGAIHGNNRNIKSWSLEDVLGAKNRRLAAKEFLKQIETERGRAAIVEPMIALGMDPNDNQDYLKYKEALESAIGLESHLDDIIKLEKEMIFKQERDALSGKRSRYDVRGDLEDRCFAYDDELKRYKNNDADCVRYRAKRRGALVGWERSEHVYDRERLYEKIFGGFLGSSLAQKAAKFDPQFLKKVLDVTAKKLRPMPAYTPGESKAELDRLKINIDENKIKKILYEEMYLFYEMMSPENRPLQPTQAFEKIKKLVDSALINKSFGFSQRITNEYIDELKNLINRIDKNNNSEQEEWTPKKGFGSF